MRGSDFTAKMVFLPDYPKSGQCMIGGPALRRALLESIQQGIYEQFRNSDDGIKYHRH